MTGKIKIETLDEEKYIHEQEEISNMDNSCIYGTCMWQFYTAAQAEGDVQEASEQTGAKEGEHSVKYIHLNSHDGDDKNDGLTEESSVKTFAKAKSLIQDGDIICLIVMLKSPKTKHGI